jgi:ferric-dicitrate binding protein FerR (iron transport regulator)
MADDTDSYLAELQEMEQKLRLVRMKELPPEARGRFMRRAAEKLAARRRLSPRPWARPLAVAATIGALLLLDIWLGAAQTRRITRLVGGGVGATEPSRSLALRTSDLEARKAMLAALLKSPENPWEL